MPTYNSVTARADAQALMPEDVASGILQDVQGGSAVLSLARRLPNLTRAQQRIPVLGVFPTAGFVSGDTGLKQTTRAAWENVYLNVEELAVIIPIPEAVLADSEFDLFAQIRPQILTALGAAIDAAVLYGTNKPSTWPSDILTGANAASQKISLASFADLYDALLGPGGAMDLVEQDGFMIDGSIGAITMRAQLRGLRDANGQPIFLRSMQSPGQYELDGSPILFPKTGAITQNAATALLVTGEWDQLVYAIRQDITYKVLTEAVLTDGAGNIIYNLAQQDMVALRVVMRLAVALPNPPSHLNENDTTRYPFAVLTS